jgi:guanylate kinase
MSPPPKEARGLLMAICGPAGTGKTTLRDRLISNHSGIEPIVTCTTRPPRGCEQNGVAYHFLSEREFDEALERGDFLEWAKVHLWRYGTRKSSVFGRLENHVDLLVNVDVQGARAYRRAFGAEPGMSDRLVTVFVMPPDFETIRRRLQARGEDTPEQIERRLKTAQEEIEQWTEFDYCILTGSRDEDYARLESIWQAEKCRVSRLRGIWPPGR